MITVQNISKNEQTRHNECDQLDEVEIKIDRGASLRGALRTGNWGGTGKKPQGEVRFFISFTSPIADTCYICIEPKVD